MVHLIYCLTKLKKKSNNNNNKKNLLVEYFLKNVRIFFTLVNKVGLKGT